MTPQEPRRRRRTGYSLQAAAFSSASSAATRQPRSTSKPPPSSPKPRKPSRGSPPSPRYTDELRPHASGMSASPPSAPPSSSPASSSGWEGWEDSAVPPELLGAYLRDLFATASTATATRPPCTATSARAASTSASPSSSRQQPKVVAAYRQFLEEAADIVLKYGGSFSGEHGDGQSRAASCPKCSGRN